MELKEYPNLVRTPQSLKATFPSDPAHIAAVRTAIEGFVTSSGFDEKTAGEIGLVVNEAVANVIRHAYGSAEDKPIELAVELRGDDLHISLRDWGSGKHPLPPGKPVPPPDPLRPGGLGLVCMRSLMDEIVFTPQSRGMLLTMRRSRRSS